MEGDGSVLSTINKLKKELQTHKTLETWTELLVERYNIAFPDVMSIFLVKSSTTPETGRARDQGCPH